MYNTSIYILLQKRIYIFGVSYKCVCKYPEEYSGSLKHSGSKATLYPRRHRGNARHRGVCSYYGASRREAWRGPHFVLDTCSQVRAGLRAEEEESFVPPKKGFLKADSETSEISICRRKSQCYFCVRAKRRAPTKGCPGRRLEYQTFSPWPTSSQAPSSRWGLHLDPWRAERTLTWCLTPLRWPECPLHVPTWNNSRLPTLFTICSSWPPRMGG